MINKINKLSQAEFVKVFANIFENSSWIASELYKIKPFDNLRTYLQNFLLFSIMLQKKRN